MTTYSTALATASLTTLLALFAPAPVARADIFQWEYINPANPGLGKQPSTMLAPDGAGANAAPGGNLSNRNLTKAYLINADLSQLPVADEEGQLLYFIYANLTAVNLSQADLSNARLFEANLTGANLTGAEVRGALFHGTGITTTQLYSTASYQAHDLTGISLDGNDLPGVNLAGQNLTSSSFSSATLTGANFSQANATNARFQEATLVNADLSQANLTNANFADATLTGANLTGAEVRGAYFGQYQGGSGIGLAQLYSTASYQAHDFTGIGLFGNNLVGASLAGQNLTNANLISATLTNADLSQANLSHASFTGDNFFGVADLRGANLSGANLTNAYFGGSVSCGDIGCAYNPGANLTNANLSGADARGANFYLATLDGANTSNLIQSDGHIAGLDLTTGASLVVRDYDGNQGVGVGIPIVVEQHLAMDATGTLRLVFDADPWDSLISFAPGIPVALGGTLDLTFAPDVNVATQSGRTIDLFDWTGVTPTGAFTVASPYTWDLSRLYTTGEVTLTAVTHLPGDYNSDDIVDAADYTVWRDNLGSEALVNRGAGITGPVGAADYDVWKANFGQSLGAGSGAALPLTAPLSPAVPEPSTLTLAGLIGLGGCSLRRRPAVRRS